MKKQLTELVFILDRSGSMAGLEADTIGGFNAMMEKQKATPGETLVSTVLFDHEVAVLHDRVPLEKVPALTDREYCARGCTALLDAVGGAIHHIGNIHKYARAEDVPEHTIFVITTDGMENASHRYSKDEIKRINPNALTLISNVGPVIGSHVGPGMLAVVFWGNDKREQLSVADRIANKVKGGK